jgi:hypothetical protein
MASARLARDARELLFELRLELEHERLAPLLAHSTPLAGASSPDRLLDRIERRDALESFAGDRRVAALGDVEEGSAQMRPTEGERDRLTACRVGDSCRRRSCRTARYRDSARAEHVCAACQGSRSRLRTFVAIVTPEAVAGLPTCFTTSMFAVVARTTLFQKHAKDHRK